MAVQAVKEQKPKMQVISEFDYMDRFKLRFVRVGDLLILQSYSKAKGCWFSELQNTVSGAINDQKFMMIREAMLTAYFGDD